MTLVAGAVQFLNAARLAVKNGVAPSIPTLLGNTNGGGSLLDIARTDLMNVGGFGLSASARKLNDQLMNNSYASQLLSLTAGADATTDGAATMIKGLRAKLPQSMIREDLRDPPAEKNPTDGISSNPNGAIVDKEA